MSYNFTTAISEMDSAVADYKHDLSNMGSIIARACTAKVNEGKITRPDQLETNIKNLLKDVPDAVAKDVLIYALVATTNNLAGTNPTKSNEDKKSNKTANRNNIFGREW